MMKFGDREIAKKVFVLQKKPIKIWDINVDNILISELVKTKTKS